jgi:hypothetical protein
MALAESSVRNEEVTGLQPLLVIIPMLAASNTSKPVICDSSLIQTRRAGGAEWIALVAGTALFFIALFNVKQARCRPPGSHTRLRVSGDFGDPLKQNAESRRGKVVGKQS